MVTVIETKVVRGRTVYTCTNGRTTYKTVTKPGSRRRVDWTKHRRLSRQLAHLKGRDWWEMSDHILDVLDGVPVETVHQGS